MAMSETVTLYARSISGEDENGDPVETWTPTVVEGALVYELAGSDLADADRPDGKRVNARVQLPDEFMSTVGRDSLKGCKLALTSRGQAEEDAYWVIGSPNHAPDMPTKWSTTIEIGKVDG